MSSTLSENCDWGTRLSQEMLLVSRSGKAAGLHAFDEVLGLEPGWFAFAFSPFQAYG